MCSTSTAHHLGCHLQHPPLPNASWGRLCLDSCPVRWKWTFGCGHWHGQPLKDLLILLKRLLLRWWHRRHRIWGGCLTAFLLRGMNTLITWRTSHHRLIAWIRSWTTVSWHHRLEKMLQTNIKQRWATKQKNSKIVKTDTLLIHLFKKTWLIPSIYSIYLHLSAKYQLSKNIGWKDPKLQRQNNKLLQLLWSLSPASLELQVFVGELAWRNDLCHCNLLDRY